MVRSSIIDQNGMKKGAWSEEEDNKLRAYVQRYGHWNWRQLPKFAGLTRCGKSCRLRWINYLKPGVRRGNYSPEEENFIVELHRRFGSRWSLIAVHLPGRVDNDIKNHWHSYLRRKMKIQAALADEDQDECGSFSMTEYCSNKQVSFWQDGDADEDSPTTSNKEESFWPQTLASSHGNDDLLRWESPAALEEEIMSPFSSYLDEINMDYWLHELMPLINA